MTGQTHAAVMLLNVVRVMRRRGVHAGLLQRVVGINPVILELAIKRGATNAQFTGDLAHLPR